MAANDLTTVADVKNWLGVASNITGGDAALALLVTATSADFLQAIDRFDFLTANYTEIREGDGGSRMTLRHWPVTAVGGVTVAGILLAASPDKVQTGYYVDMALDPERRNQLYVASGVFTDAAVVSVAYTAGYATPPADVVQAVIEWVAARYKGRPGQGVSSQREAGGEHTTYDREGAMPATTAAVVERYKRTWPSTNKYADDRAQSVTRITRVFTQSEQIK